MWNGPKFSVLFWSSKECSARFYLSCWYYGMSYGDDIVYSEMWSFKLGPFSKDRLIMLEFFQLFAVRISFQNKHV